MANLYILLDATNPNYKRLLSNMKKVVNRSFQPRLNLNRTKALIQIKDKYLARTTSLRNSLRSFVLGSGNEAWARKEVSKPGWQEEL